VQSFEDLRWRMTRGALDAQDLTLEVAGEDGRPSRQMVLPLSRIEAKDADPQMFRKIGVLAPLTRSEIGEVMAGSARNARACAMAIWCVPSEARPSSTGSNCAR
jgi:regulator of sigma E protease